MRNCAGENPEVEIGKTYILKRNGEEVRVVSKAFTLDAEMWHVESVASGKRLFPVFASGLEPLPAK